MVAERPLRVDGRADRVARAREREEERVALRVDLACRRDAERVAHDAPVVARDLRVVHVAELLEEPGRSFDVR